MDYQNRNYSLSELELETRNDKHLKYYLSEPKISKGVCFFIHGIGDSSETFSKLISNANLEGYSAIYYDLPGFSGNKDYELEDFNENLDVLSQLIYLHSHPENKNYFVGHSMGGLITLLTLVTYDFSVNPSSILAIEPSLTSIDFDFFQSIQEPPLGMGYIGFLERNKFQSDDSAYAGIYYKNLINSSVSAFRECVVGVNKDFLSYQNSIFQSRIPFIYTYGMDSSGISFREKMKERENVEVKAFEHAKHWVHVDAEHEFCNFFVRDFLKS